MQCTGVNMQPKLEFQFSGVLKYVHVAFPNVSECFTLGPFQYSKRLSISNASATYNEGDPEIPTCDYNGMARSIVAVKLVKCECPARLFLLVLS
jgi:hypothetical protein